MKLDLSMLEPKAGASQHKQIIDNALMVDDLQSAKFPLPNIDDVGYNMLYYNI